ncbi:hypothetical protein E0500_030230 [Streptomyces sp. KM273126]|nr:hypothetical protein [Streptomyces sp. KM273126]
MPVRVVLPADPVLGTDQQEVVARLWKRRQTETGWVNLVGLPAFRTGEDGSVPVHQRLAGKRAGRGQVPPP